jgi:outer membrane protein assembly factor BamD
MRKKLTLIVVCVALFNLSGCFADKTIEKEAPQLTPENLYRNASDAFKNQRYKEAASLYADITYQHPYYKWAAQSRIMEVYSYYRMQDYDSAVYAIDNYISMYPVSRDVQYAYYMKALCFYNQIFIPDRDQAFTIKAKVALNLIISKFPRSIYAKDAKVKLDLIADHLAAHEMVVGRYYINSGNILAAIKRFKVVVEKYSTTHQIEESLYRLVESYAFLGMHKEAKIHAAVLGHNHSNSKWYKSAYDLMQRSE